MRLSFYAGLLAFICTISQQQTAQAITIDGEATDLNKTIEKMMKPSKSEQLPSKIQKQNEKTKQKLAAKSTDAVQKKSGKSPEELEKEKREKQKIEERKKAEEEKRKK